MTWAFLRGIVFEWSGWLGEGFLKRRAGAPDCFVINMLYFISLLLLTSRYFKHSNLIFLLKISKPLDFSFSNLIVKLQISD